MSQSKSKNFSQFFSAYGMLRPMETTTSQPTPETTQPVKNLVDTLSDGTLVKRRMPRQRACNQPAAKGKICAGHLKRWFFFGDEVKRKFGAEVEIYRCENCRTLYLPDDQEEPRTRVQAW